MSLPKKSSSSLTAEERILLQRIKSDLKNQGIPQEQWASMMQTEISNYRSSQRQQKRKLKKDNSVILAFKRLGKKLQRVVMKKALKTQGQYSDEELDRMMKAMTGEIPPEMALPNVIPDTDIENAGKHGTFLTTAQDHTRKKVEVFFDDDDEDDDDDD